MNNMKFNKEMNKSMKKKKMSIKEMEELFVNSNDRHALTPLFERYYYGVKRYAYNFVKDNDKAAEMAILSFERAWDNKEKYNIEKAHFCTWLYTICKNICLYEINQKMKSGIIDNDINDIYDSKMYEDAAVATQENPNDQFIVENDKVNIVSRDEIIKRFYDVSLGEINNLDTRSTLIMKEKLIKNKKLVEIAEEQKLNLSTVKNILYKGEKLIKELVQQKYKDLYDMYVEVI